MIFASPYPDKRAPLFSSLGRSGGSVWPEILGMGNKATCRHLDSSVRKALRAGVRTGGKTGIAGLLATLLLMAVFALGTADRVWAGIAPDGDLSGKGGTLEERAGEMASGPRDLGSFRDWTLRALRGDPVAQYRLGLLYEEEGSETADFAEAARWYRKAAQQGVADAQQRLGLLYARSKGLPGSRVEAYYWLSLAAERLAPGLHRDQTNEMRNILAAFMTKAELDRARILLENRRAD